MDNNIKRHPYCPMRHYNGNCSVIGGFCTSVSEPICEGLQKAYKKDRQELIGEWIPYTGMQPPEFHGKHYCSNCYHTLRLGLNGGVYNFCPNCGSKNERRR